MGSSGSGIGGPTSNSSSVGSSSSVGMGPNATGRLIGLSPLLPSSSPQGTSGPPYMVTTNSGTITVVTRTVAAGQGMALRSLSVMNRNGIIYYYTAFLLM